MPVAAALLALVLTPGPAAAHGVGLPIGPGDLWHHWTFDPWVLVPLLAAHWLYGRGVLKLWARAGWGRGIEPRRVAAFAGGEVALVAALVSPLDPLGETLLTAHMVQHGLLIALAPPLLLAGRPGAALPWAFPARVRKGVARSFVRTVAHRLAWLARPLPATAVHGAALWLWHAPPAFDAALESSALHTLEHIAFFGTALLWWQSLILAARSPHTVPPALAGAFLTLLHGGFLSTLITFAPQPLYRWYVGRTEVWGLSALEDQQLAGILMGAPLGVAYLAAGLALAGRLLVPASRAEVQAPQPQDAETAP